MIRYHKNNCSVELEPNWLYLGQIWSEIFILLLLAFTLSWPLIAFALPFFNELTQANISLNYFVQFSKILYLLAVPVLIFAVTLVFTWGRIRKMTKGNSVQLMSKSDSGKRHFPVFNVAQLAVSVALIVGSIIILKQINYITQKNIGLNKSVLEVKIPRQHKNIASVFKEKLEKHSMVNKVAIANASPVLEHYILSLHYTDNGVEKQYKPSVFAGDRNYIEALGIEMVQGEGFSGNAADSKKCVINQSLANLFPNRNLIGDKLPGNNDITVAGVVKDFHYGSLKEVVEPGYIAFSENGHYLMVNPQKGQEKEVSKLVADIWTELIPDFQMNVETIGAHYEWIHRENTNYAKLIGACCFISIFLSMIGLFALSFNTSLKRTKEIGIRKVNGAKILEILTMLNKDFVKWVVIAFVLACPLAWLVMTKWLENFVYKTTLSWWIFALAGFAALIIALLTVSWQSWRAATRNPVEVLRYE